MTGFDPYAPRASRPVPATASSRVAPGGDAGAPGDPDRRALIPSGPRRDSTDRRRARERGGDTARAVSRAALSLQTDTPAPRRGLRADSCEQGRYRQAYETAMAPAAAGPRLEKRA